MFNWLINKINIMSRTNRISRTKAVSLIDNSKGKFFTVTFKKNNGDLRVINGNFKKGNFTPMGYMSVYSASDKGYRSVNPKTITHLSVNGVEYKVK